MPSVHLASADDANTHLDGTKIKFANEAEANGEATEADRIVRARLGGAFGAATVEVWSYDPDTGWTASPGIVREAASLLMASYLYAKKYSEETLNENDYAARLEARANMFLDGLVDGTFTLSDDPGVIDFEHLQAADFYPNDATLVTEDQNIPGLHPGDDLRFFTIDRVF